MLVLSAEGLAAARMVDGSDLSSICTVGPSHLVSTFLSTASGLSSLGPSVMDCRYSPLSTRSARNGASNELATLKSVQLPIVEQKACTTDDVSVGNCPAMGALCTLHIFSEVVPLVCE